MAEKGTGGSTAFESMTHEQMLAWLDEADAATVMVMGTKLAAAASQIALIAQELKSRPGQVTWQGKDGEQFRTWSADLANQTLRLADYASGAAKWLTEASGMIAEVKSAMPRDPQSGQAKLTAAEKTMAAANAHRNDPDASKAQQDAARDIAAVEAQREAKRLEAARQMRKLAQSYELSATQMDRMERPVFPPPPQRIMPPEDIRPDAAKDVNRSGPASPQAEHGATGLAQSGGTGRGPEHVSAPDPGGRSGRISPEAPVNMGIDSVAAPPERSTSGSTHTPSLPSAPARPESGLTPPTALPPVSGTPGQHPHATSGGTRPYPGTRPPGTAGQGPPGTPAAGRAPREPGVVGGRPVVPGEGRSAGGLSRGTVVGGEGPYGRGPAVPGTGPVSPGAARAASGPSGTTGGRPLPGQSGIVGGRPVPPGSTGARTFTPGGSGLVHGAGRAAPTNQPEAKDMQANRRPAGEPGGVVGRQPTQSGGTTRGAGGAITQHGAGPVGRAGAAVPPASHAMPSRGDRRRGDRPDYLVEDEETWQRDNRRVVPPVID